MLRLDKLWESVFKLLKKINCLQSPKKFQFKTSHSYLSLSTLVGQHISHDTKVKLLKTWLLLSVAQGD